MEASVADGLKERHSWQALRESLPDGKKLDQPAWQRRHRIVLWILVAHVPFLWVFGVWGGEALGATFRAEGILHVTAEIVLLLGLIGFAAWPSFPRRMRATFSSFALVTSSGLLTHFSGGFIEAHFHFFVVLAIIAFYQDWFPFILGIFYVALHHGVVGTLWPESVYNHAAGIAYPWAWALIHATFILCIAAVLTTLTHLQLRAESRREVATEAMRREQERTRLVLENTGSIVFATDDKLRWTMLQGRDLAGVALDPANNLGRSVYEVAQNEHPEVVQAYERALAGESFSTDLEFRGRVFHAMFRPQWDVETGRPIGVMGCATDITERARVERAERLALMQRANIENLKAAERFRRQLFNTAAHELNTPLTPIQIQLQMLRSGQLGELNREQEKALEMLERNMNRLGTLAKDILDVARIQNARLELFATPVDFSRLISECIESFEAAAKARGIRLSVDVDQGVVATVDERRITQVLFNLLSNATKFTGEGGTVVVRARTLDSKVRVSVEDTGRGLRAEDITRLFQPFSQVSDGDSPREGSGLGLYITRGIIERHGGRIWAESAGPSHGSTFVFEIPLDPARAGKEGAGSYPGDPVVSVREHEEKPAGDGRPPDLVAQ